jgi:hypothetical protein
MFVLPYEHSCALIRSELGGSDTVAIFIMPAMINFVPIVGL